MNFIPKNPNDPKYQEFHDGEYEFWPMDDTIKTKSISIPAAVVSGLELLAAVAAATGSFFVLIVHQLFHHFQPTVQLAEVE